MSSSPFLVLQESHNPTDSSKGRKVRFKHLRSDQIWSHTRYLTKCKVGGKKWHHREMRECIIKTSTHNFTPASSFEYLIGLGRKCVYVCGTFNPFSELKFGKPLTGSEWWLAPRRSVGEGGGGAPFVASLPAACQAVWLEVRDAARDDWLEIVSVSSPGPYSPGPSPSPEQPHHS